MSVMDDEDKILHLRNKQMKQELQGFQKQLRMQKAFSELDMSGKPISRKKQPLTAEQAATAMSIIYDA